ncbi:MAG: sulfotransferase [Methyloceanibacter sp.]
MQKPVIILGAPRSGTTLLSRIVGVSDEIFLITEIAPRLKDRHCPEDRSGVSDSELWRSHFSFAAWPTDKPRPLSERPIFDLAKLESMRARYLEMANGKRLVIKNPLTVARVDMLKIMFPDAIFVFSMRAPWPTIQSAVHKGKSSYILRTEFVNGLPDDLVLRAAASWAESIDVLMRESDSNWIVIRHEELVARPQAVVAALYDHAGLAQVPGHAWRIPENRDHDYSFIKYRLMGHPYRAEIFSLLRDRARAIGYDPSLWALPGNGLRYAAETWLGELRRTKKTKKSKARLGRIPELARA